MRTPKYLVATACIGIASTAHAQWEPNNPIDTAPAKEDIPEYVQHATYTANLAPVPGPVEVGYNYHLPPGYDNSEDRYPVIYQLGGNTDTESKGLVDRGVPNRMQEKMLDGTIRPTITVYLNSPGTLPSYQDLEPTFYDELIPHIDAKFRTVDTPECRHVEGYSRGGSGAPLVAFRRPDLFRAAVSVAGSGTEGVQEVMRANKEEALGLDVRLRVVILEADRVAQGNLEFQQFLNDESIPFDLVSLPGGAHDTNLYYNNPDTYDDIGYGNIVWHEAVFQEHGCQLEPDEGMGGTAGAGGSTGVDPAVQGGSAGAVAAAGDTGGIAQGGSGAVVATAGGAGTLPVTMSESSGSEGGCSVSRGAARSAGWLLLLLAAAGLRRRALFHE